MSTDAERHREAQRRHQERMRAAGAPSAADIQRSIAHAVRAAVGASGGGVLDRQLLGWIARDAAARLVGAGFNPTEVAQRLTRALAPATLTQIDGECVRLDADCEEAAEADCGPAMGM